MSRLSMNARRAGDEHSHRAQTRHRRREVKRMGLLWAAMKRRAILQLACRNHPDAGGVSPIITDPCTLLRRGQRKALLQRQAELLRQWEKGTKGAST